MARPFILRKEKRSILRKTDEPRNTLRGQGVDLSTTLSSSVSISAAQNNSPKKVLTSGNSVIGNFIKVARKNILGSILLSSKEVKNISKNILGNVVSSVRIVKSIGKSIISSIGSSGGTTESTGYSNIINNSVNILGNVIKEVTKNTSATVSLSGRVVKNISTRLSSSITIIDGNLLLSPRKILSSTTNSTSNIIRKVSIYLFSTIFSSGVSLKNLSIILSSMIISSGNLEKSIIQRLFSASISSVAILLNHADKNIIGGITSNGILNNITGVILTVTGSITSNSAIIKNINYSISNSINVSGSEIKNILKYFISSIIITGGLFNNFGILFTSSIAISGNTIKNALVNIFGLITANIFIVRQYILDNLIGNERVDIYDNGIFQNSVTISQLTGAQGIAIDTNREIFAIVDNVGDTVHFYDYDLTYLNESLSLTDGNNQPRGLTFDPSGSLFIVDQDFQNLYRYGFNNNTGNYDFNGIVVTFAPSGESYNPRGLFIDEDNIFILNRSSNDGSRAIYVFDTSGNYESSIDLDEDNNAGEGLSITPERIYVVNSGSSSTSEKVFVYGRNGERFANEDYNLVNSSFKLDGIASRLISEPNTFMTFNKVLFGVISSVSSRSRDISHIISNMVSSVGKLIAGSQRGLMIAAGILISGKISKNTIINIPMSIINSSGNLVKSIATNLISNIINSGGAVVIGRFVKLLLESITVINSSISKSISKTLDAVISVPSHLIDMTEGAISFIKSITVSGVLQLQISRIISNNVSVRGIALKNITLQIFTGSIGVVGKIVRHDIGKILSSIILVPAQTSLSIAKNLAANINPIGRLVRVLSIILSTIITPFGTIQKSITKTFISTINSISSFVTDEMLNYVAEGTIAITGVITLSIDRVISNSVNISSVIIKSINRTLTNIINIQSNTIKNTGKILSAGVGAIGSLSDMVNNTITLTGQIIINSRLIISIRKNIASARVDISGSSLNRVSKLFNGTINLISSVSKNIGKSLISTIGSVGNIPNSFVTQHLMATGNVLIEGILNNIVTKNISGTIISTGNNVLGLLRRVMITGGIFISGGISRVNVDKNIANTIVSSSILSKNIVKNIFDNQIISSGVNSVVRMTHVLISSSINVSGSVIKSISVILSSIINSIGGLNAIILYYIILSGGVAAVGEIISGVSKILRRTGVRINKVVSTGNIQFNIVKNISSSIYSLGIISKSFSQLLTGRIYITTVHVVSITKILTNTIASIGRNVISRSRYIMLSGTVTVLGSVMIRHLLDAIPALITSRMEKVAQIKIDFISIGTL